MNFIEGMPQNAGGILALPPMSLPIPAKAISKRPVGKSICTCFRTERRSTSGYQTRFTSRRAPRRPILAPGIAGSAENRVAASETVGSKSILSFRLK